MLRQGDVRDNLLTLTDGPFGPPRSIQASTGQAWVAELWMVGSSLHSLSAPTRPKVPPTDAWSGTVSRPWSPRSSHPCWTVASPSDSVLTSWGKRKGHGRGRWWLPPSCPHFPGLSPHKLLPSDIPVLSHEPLGWQLWPLSVAVCLVCAWTRASGHEK